MDTGETRAGINISKGAAGWGLWEQTQGPDEISSAKGRVKQTSISVSPALGEGGFPL